MFLVRESGSCEGNLVLSVVKKDKIVHRQIFQVNSIVFSKRVFVAKFDEEPGYL